MIASNNSDISLNDLAVVADQSLLDIGNLVLRGLSVSPDTDEDDCTPHYLFLDDNNRYSPYQHILLMTQDYPEVLVGWEVVLRCHFLSL